MDTNQVYKFLYILRKSVVYLLLTVFAVIMLVPFYWMLATALKSTAELQDVPATLFPHHLMWNNFLTAMSPEYARFDLYFRNTVIVAFFSTLGIIITTILAAFAFSRLSFKGRDTVFTILLSTMMIPGEMLIITNYVTVARFGWMNSFYALIIPFTVSVFYIFFLRQNFRQIPNELYYAAKIDGTGDFKYLLWIMIPIASPTIVTITILSALGAWNAYIWPNLVTNSDSLRLVANGLNNAFNQTNGEVAYNLQMAASAIVTIPFLIIFLLLRKQIMRGVSRSGIKG